MGSGWMVSAGALVMVMVGARVPPPRGFRITSRDGAPLKGPCDPADLAVPWYNNTRITWVEKPPYRPPYKPCPVGYQTSPFLEQPCVPSWSPSERPPSESRQPVAPVRPERPVRPSGCPVGLNDPRCSLVAADSVLRPVYCPPDCCPCPELMEANEAIPWYVTRPTPTVHATRPPGIHITVTTRRPRPPVYTAVISIHDQKDSCPPGYFKIVL